MKVECLQEVVNQLVEAASPRRREDEDWEMPKRDPKLQWEQWEPQNQ